MRFSINIPNFGDFADAQVVASLASATEASGWDALFIWDHIVYDRRVQWRIGERDAHAARRRGGDSRTR